MKLPSFLDSIDEKYKKYLDPKYKVFSYSLLQLNIYDLFFAFSVLLFILFRNTLMRLQKQEELPISNEGSSTIVSEPISDCKTPEELIRLD